ncbi:hypothetical protein [Nocardioides limicola]|uniref:hypothetical protein n=1 Tax=Nocardioides limicola TaxID=2803368 RepID=UPI00193B5F8E|nr:hypothetical protein [Nocardioides sp. DJM-14]
MLLLGLVFLVLAILAIAAVALDGTGTVDVLGIETNALGIFLLGLACGCLIWWGLALTRAGVRRELKTRRDRKELASLKGQLATGPETSAAPAAAAEPAHGEHVAVTDAPVDPPTEDPDRT